MVTPVASEPVGFWTWWTSEPHRMKYYADDPVCIAAHEAWDAATAHPPTPVVPVAWRVKHTDNEGRVTYTASLYGPSPLFSDAFEFTPGYAHPPVQPTSGFMPIQQLEQIDGRTQEKAEPVAQVHVDEDGYRTEDPWTDEDIDNLLLALECDPGDEQWAADAVTVIKQLRAHPPTQVEPEYDERVFTEKYANPPVAAEPVAWMALCDGVAVQTAFGRPALDAAAKTNRWEIVPLYAHPPTSEWNDAIEAAAYELSQAHALEPEAVEFWCNRLRGLKR